MCLWKNKIEADKESFWNAILPGRYLLVLQGFFALYCGLIYNDFMSIPLRLFGSCYGHPTEGTASNAKISEDCNYPFGIDPGWYHTFNELTFLNSFATPHFRLASKAKEKST